MASRSDIRVDITDAVGLDTPAETAAWVYVPDLDSHPDSPTVLFAFPGGTYSRAYYDLHVHGREGYSFAEHLAAAGYIVIACDHIGIGDSSPYEPFAALTTDVVVRADRATVEGVMARLAAGTLIEGLAPVMNPFIIGVGHSLGAMYTTLQQARYRTFNAVALLGFSLLPHSESDMSRTADVVEAFSKLSDPTRPPRAIFHQFFHDERVPDDVIATDDVLAVRLYSWVLERTDLNAIHHELAEAGSHIDVPIFLGYGARDVSPDPHREVSAYPNSVDITTFVLPDSAHCFNFAETRGLFFDRIAGWGHAVSKTYRQRQAIGTLTKKDTVSQHTPV